MCLAKYDSKVTAQIQHSVGHGCQELAKCGFLPQTGKIRHFNLQQAKYGFVAHNWQSIVFSPGGGKIWLWGPKTGKIWLVTQNWKNVAF